MTRVRVSEDFSWIVTLVELLVHGLSSAWSSGLGFEGLMLPQLEESHPCAIPC